MASRRLASLTRRTSAPSTVTAPPVTSCSRGMSASAVDLPGARGSDQRDRRARGRLEAETRETGPAIGVDEVARPGRPRGRVPAGSGVGIRRVDDARLLVDDREHAHKPREPLLYRGIQRPERAQRARRDQQRRDEPGEVADRVRADRRPPAGEADHRRDRRAAQHLQHRIDAGPRPGHAQQRAVELGEGVLCARAFPPLPDDRRAPCGPGRSSRSATPPSRPYAPACRRRRGGCACRCAGSARRRADRARRR